MQRKIFLAFLAFCAITHSSLGQLYSFPWKVKEAELACISFNPNSELQSPGFLDFVFEFENTYGDTIIIKEVRHVGIAKVQFDRVIPPGATGKIHYQRFENLNTAEIREVSDILQVNSNINPWEFVSVRAYVVGSQVKERALQSDGSTIYRQDYQRDQAYYQLHVDAQGKMISYGLMSANGNKWNNWKEKKDGKIAEINYGFIVDVNTISFSRNVTVDKTETFVYTGFIGEEAYEVELFGEIDYSGSQKVHLKTGTTQLVVQSNSFEGSVVIVPERLVNNMNFKICLGQKNTPFIRMQNVKAYFDQDTTWYALSLLNSRGDSIQNLADLKDIELYLRKKGIQQFEYNGTPYFLVFNLAEYPVNKRFGLIEQLSNMKKVEHVGLWYSGCMGVGSKGILSGEIIVEKKFPEYHHNLHDYNDLFNRYKVSADYDYSYNYIKLKYLGQVNSNFIQVVNKIAESGQFLYTMPATYFPVPISYGKGTGN